VRLVQKKEGSFKRTKKMAEEKINTKRLLITASIVLVTAVVVGGATYWVTSKDFVTTTTETKNVTAVPNDFTKITVDGVDINVPLEWGSAKIESYTPSKDASAPLPEFIGQGASFQDILGTINVSTYPRIYNSEQGADNTEMDKIQAETLTVLEDIYNTKTITPERLLLLDWANIMPINSIVKPFNPRYIESDDGEWRGVWAVAFMGQDINTNPNGVALMYNQKLKKIATFMIGIETKKSTELWKEIDKQINEANENREIQLNFEGLQEDVDNYLESAYYTDSEFKNFIDNEFLIVLKTL